MSEALVELVSHMPPLRSPEVRLLLFALAHLADDDGDCGTVPVSRLVEATQMRAETLRKQLAHLELELGLIARREHSGHEPSRMRVHVARLNNPSANRPPATHSHKALGGPFDGKLMSAPTVDRDTWKTVYSHQLPHFPQRPVLYRPAARHTRGMASLDGLRYEPATLEFRGDDGRVHVYRLSTQTWLYCGISTKLLAGYTRSHLTVSRLFTADIVSMEEFDLAVRAWTRDHAGSAADFAAHLNSRGAHLFEPGSPPVITNRVAASLLDAHQRWSADTSTQALEP